MRAKKLRDARRSRDHDESRSCKACFRPDDSIAAVPNATRSYAQAATWSFMAWRGEITAKAYEAERPACGRELCRSPAEFSWCCCRAKRLLSGECVESGEASKQRNSRDHRGSGAFAAVLPDDFGHRCDAGRPGVGLVRKSALHHRRRSRQPGGRRSRQIAQLLHDGLRLGPPGSSCASRHCTSIPSCALRRHAVANAPYVAGSAHPRSRSGTTSRASAHGLIRWRRSPARIPFESSPWRKGASGHTGA